MPVKRLLCLLSSLLLLALLCLPAAAAPVPPEISAPCGSSRPAQVKRSGWSDG